MPRKTKTQTQPQIIVDDALRGFYGTNTETYFRGARGGVYLIQGPDLRPGEKYQRISAMPAGAIRLSDDTCADLDVPEACREEE